MNDEEAVAMGSTQRRLKGQREFPGAPKGTA
jgi:hypothetical protein